MANIEVKITNLAEIKAAFRKAPGLMTKYLNQAIQRSIFSIERDSKINSPVLTGFLRASHQSLFTNLRGEVGPTASYAIFVHEGTRFMRPRPFLLEAVKSNERKIQDEFKDAVQNTLNDIGRSV